MTEVRALLQGRVGSLLSHTLESGSFDFAQDRLRAPQFVRVEVGAWVGLLLSRKDRDVGRVTRARVISLKSKAPERIGGFGVR